MFFPTDMLPGGLRQAALVLPITHALEALRATLGDVASHVAVLAMFALVGLPLAMTLFAAAVGWGKRSGTLGHY